MIWRGMIIEEEDEHQSEQESGIAGRWWQRKGQQTAAEQELQ